MGDAMYDVIIIGAGPAGLTSALYLLRANKKVLLLEAKAYGGQIINSAHIENYPGIENISGFDLATNLYQQVTRLGGQIKYELVTKVDKDKVVTTNKNTYQSKAIIIATGLEKRLLNIPNEKEYTGKGISYCATCDGHFYKGKVVAIIGGGNTALEDALYLSDLAKKVYLIHRNSTFKGELKYQEEIKKRKNIETILNATITSLDGQEYLNKITLDNDKGLDVDGLFIAIGQKPQNEIFKDLVSLNDDGYIIADDLKTKVAGIFVAGDNRAKEVRQLTTATSDGTIAAHLVIKYLQ